MRIHCVKDVAEAVSLASDMKGRREYDWFRGQVQNRPLKSSFARLQPTDNDEALQKLARFEHWVKSTPGLETIVSSPDAIIAVAQHYGIPTNFLDFTTDPAVAGFFASDRPPKNPSQDSCILCLNTEDLKAFWGSMPSEYPAPEFIRLDVPNLWRLEAQAGTFLFCPYTNFEHIYDLDRILFAYTGPLLTPTTNDIYPARKSQLEVLLDQYFMNEKLIEGDRWIQHETSAGLITILDMTREDKCEPDLISGEPPPTLASWNPERLRLWLNVDREYYSDVRSTLHVDIKISAPLDDPVRVQGDIKTQLVGQANLHPDIRTKLVEWRVQFAKRILPVDLENHINRALKRLWDGFRVLPYPYDDIARGMSNCIVVALLVAINRNHGASDSWLAAAGRCFGEAIEVEFGSHDGSYARGYASKAMVLSAVRSDIGAFLNPLYKDVFIRNISGLLQAVRAPERLFEFDGLAKVFVQQLAPTQVLTRGDHAIFYSPARLEAFGLP